MSQLGSVMVINRLWVKPITFHIKSLNRKRFTFLEEILPAHCLWTQITASILSWVSSLQGYSVCLCLCVCVELTHEQDTFQLHRSLIHGFPSVKITLTVPASPRVLIHLLHFFHLCLSWDGKANPSSSFSLLNVKRQEWRSLWSTST